MKVLFATDNFSILLDESIPCVVAKAIGYPKSSEQLQEAFRQVLRACEEFAPITAGLSLTLDLSEASGATSEDSEWVLNYLYPRLEQAGISKLAIISPNVEFARMSVAEFLELPSSGALKQRMFGELEIARQWLVSTDSQESLVVK